MAFMKYFEAISAASFILGGVSLIVGNFLPATSINLNCGYYSQANEYDVAIGFFVIAIVFGIIGLIDRRRRRSSSSD